MERPDVLVIGGSGAGLAAARTAARAGARVLLLDAKQAIAQPEPAAVVAFDFLWAASLQPQAHEVRRRLDGVRLQSPAGHALDVAAPLSVLDRQAFDKRIAREAEEAGAVVRTGVRGLVVRDDLSVRGEDGTEARAAVTIFADGPASLARRFLRPTRHPDDLLWGAALRVARPGAEKERLVSLTLGAHAPGGRSQLSPLGDDAWAHWTFYRGAPSEARARARAALKLDVRLRGWDPEIVEHAEFLGVAADPVLTIPRRLVANDIMVVGGAAGQAGVELGFAAGELAGAAAAHAVRSGRTDATGLAPYARAWRRAHQWGYVATRRAFHVLARLDDASIDALLEPWSGWRIPVRDFVGLVHRDAFRRAEAAAKFAARNPRALTSVARVGLRSLWAH